MMQPPIRENIISKPLEATLFLVMWLDASLYADFWCFRQVNLLSSELEAGAMSSFGIKSVCLARLQSHYKLHSC